MVSLAQRKSISISISHGIINKKKKNQKMRSIAGPRGIWESKMYQHPNKNHASSCDLRRHPTPCPCQYIGIDNMKQARQKRKRKEKKDVEKQTMIQVNTKNPKPDPPIYSNMHPVRRKELKQRRKEKKGVKKVNPGAF